MGVKMFYASNPSDTCPKRWAVRLTRGGARFPESVVAKEKARGIYVCCVPRAKREDARSYGQVEE